MSLEDKRDLLIVNIEKAQTGVIVSVGCIRSTSAAAAGVESQMFYQPVKHH